MKQEKNFIVIVYPCFGDRTIEDEFNTDTPEDIVRYIFVGVIEDDLTLTGYGYDWGGNGSGVVDTHFLKGEDIGFQAELINDDLIDMVNIMCDKYITFGSDEDGDRLFLLATKALKDKFEGKPKLLSNNSVIVFNDSDVDIDEIDVPEFGLSTVYLDGDSEPLL